jgi:hypothetical protein
LTGAVYGPDALAALAIIYIWLIKSIGLWNIFTKADRAGVLAFIPIVNFVILMKINHRSGWFTLLLLIPFANIGWLLVSKIELAKKFGKSAGFGVLMTVLPVIGYPILGFGEATYNVNA